MPGVEVWLKDESEFGDGAWGGNKVRKLEWIIPEAHRRGVRTLFTVGGIGTHWGLAAALYGGSTACAPCSAWSTSPSTTTSASSSLRLRDSGAELHRYRNPRRLRLAAPWLIAKTTARDRGCRGISRPAAPTPSAPRRTSRPRSRSPAQVDLGLIPEPATVVTAVGSGGTAAGLALGLRLAGLRTRVFGVVVNDSFPLDAPVVARLANRTADLLRERGASLDVPPLEPADVTMRDDWLGTTYGDPTRPRWPPSATPRCVVCHSSPSTRARRWPRCETWAVRPRCRNLSSG